VNVLADTYGVKMIGTPAEDVEDTMAGA